MRFPILALFWLSICVHLVNTTLSKSDKGKKKKSDEHVVEKSSQASGTVKMGRNDAKLDDDEKSSILQNYGTLETSERNFQDGITIGYVTPWNNHGYDVAKWAAKKFTHIAPVWFQINALQLEEQLTCEIGGAHDLDHGWVDDIRKNNSAIKIVPRFLFERWQGEELKAFLTDESASRRCGKAIVEFLQRNDFDGGVVEMWLQIMSMTRGSAAEFLLEIIETWTKQFHSVGLEFIIPLTPPLDPSLNEIGIVSPKILTRLAEHVDCINVMTYDYPSSEIAGVAPIAWVAANLKYILEAGNVSPSKLSMGLNFYGYDRTNGAMDAILGKRFIELLESKNSQLEWDETAGENRVLYGNEGIAYFPTLKSIELRLLLARQLGVGIGIWELGQGLDYFTKAL